MRPQPAPKSDPTLEDPPRAPSSAAWAAMTPAERAAVVERLGPMPDSEAAPAEGDWHMDAVRASEDALQNQFDKRHRGAYIGRGLTVYYPEERRFAPDLFVVLDVEVKKRTVWLVEAEGRGLDLVLEVHYGGRRRKDAEDNVVRYAGLGIPEYFLFDAKRTILHGWRLEASGDRHYTRIVPQGGRWPVHTLGLELGLRDGLPRWYDGVGIIPLTQELNGELRLALDAALERARQAEAERDEAEIARAAAETARAAAETARAAEAAARAAEADARAAEAEARAAAEAELARVRAELERLRGGS